MKITALLVMKSTAAGDASSSGQGDPIVLANATDVSHFGYFQRAVAREFILFVGRTVAKRTPPSQQQFMQHEGPCGCWEAKVFGEAGEGGAAGDGGGVDLVADQFTSARWRSGGSWRDEREKE
ncbi:hypothetical protein Taro_038585 [Colocasia esculenta]|uniref:Longin domain-containing protein n=1 Tax=Colocasia esculenta TaxID=4460 RepID=A0A843W739_COLES|nr:hypothetical protein [Colocasia esculenta]